MHSHLKINKCSCTLVGTVTVLFLSNTSSDKDEDLETHNQAAVWNTLLYLDEGSPEQQEKVWSYFRRSWACLRTLDGQAQCESSASTEVVQALVRYGPTHPHLYELLLRFLTSTPELALRHQVDVEKILEHIEKERIIPPLGVVQILNRNGVASAGLFKDWLMGHIKEAREEVQTDQQLISFYRLEANAKLKQVAELEDPMHAKVPARPRNRMPLCVRQHGIIQKIRKNHEIKHELFLADVQDDGFKAVAAGFGKGVLNMTRLDDNRYCAVP
ncbi:hypothetical protein BDR06DRAFT_968645 [Suillus hirtellus]|nr:hypothetical protein BDR06DRAFT_968645 [Suillus hirtellus]